VGRLIFRVTHQKNDGFTNGDLEVTKKEDLAKKGRTKGGGLIGGDGNNLFPKALFLAGESSMNVPEKKHCEKDSKRKGDNSKTVIELKPI